MLAVAAIEMVKINNGDRPVSAQERTTVNLLRATEPGRELSLEGDEQRRLGDVERLIWMVNRAKKLNKCPRIPPARAAGLLGEPKAKPTAQEGVERAGLAFALVADF